MAKFQIQGRWPLLILVMAVLFTGCLSEQQRKDMVIKNMIEGAKASTSDLKHGDIFKSVDARRDGKSDGVVFEYIYKDGLAVDASMMTPENLRTQVLAEYEKDATGKKELKEFLNMGIYMRFVYKKGDGSVISDFRIDKSHLN